jgi:hypothetical protein
LSSSTHAFVTVALPVTCDLIAICEITEDPIPLDSIFLDQLRTRAPPSIRPQ